MSAPHAGMPVSRTPFLAIQKISPSETAGAPRVAGGQRKMSVSRNLASPNRPTAQRAGRRAERDSPSFTCGR